jgi:hypothetical protein
MAEEVLALCGAGEGPRIPLRSKESWVVISGLRPDETVEVVLEAASMTFYEDGTHKLLPGQFARCVYFGANRLLMCFVRV